MGWTYASSTWTQTGTTRAFLYVSTAIPNPGEASIRPGSPAHETAICIRSDADGRTCWELAIDGSNLVIRKRIFNVPQTASATAAHGLPGGQPFTLRVRLDGTLITGACIASDGTTVELTHDTSDRALITGWGFASATNAATVSQVRISGLREQITTVSEVLWALAGGGFYATYDGSSIVTIGTGLFSASDNVQAATLDGKVYLVGGGKAREVDIVARSWDAWTPTAGELPGQTTAGTTTATLISTLRGSLVLAGIPEQPLAIYGSASGEPDNWDLADLAAGHAWLESVGNSATNGNPITCVAEGPSNSLFIGCTNSINYMAGNPFEGTAEIVTRSNTYGVSGPNAAILVGTPGGEDIIAFHAPEGLMVAPLGGAPVPVSIDTLTQYMGFDHADRGTVRVTIARDPARRLLYTFVTGGDEEVYVAYAEFIGGYQTGGRGFFPFTLPVVPTCTTIWKGRNLFGSTTGKIVAFAEDGDDLGATVTTTVPAHLLHAGPVDSDIILLRVDPMLSDGSASAAVRVYAGRSPQSAYEDPQQVAGPVTMGPTSWGWVMSARAPALVLQFTSTGAFTIERVDIDYDTALRSRRSNTVAAPTPGAPCKPPAIPAAPATPDDAPDGPGPGSLPDGNPDPDDEPVAEEAQMPYPPRYSDGFSVPFDSPFYGQSEIDGFGPRVASPSPTSIVLVEGDGGNGQPTPSIDYQDWDTRPIRFGGGQQYDPLKPWYSYPVSFPTRFVIIEELTGPPVPI